MNRELILSSKDTILLYENSLDTNIIIAAPHHTPGGNLTMPCSEHPNGDENTGVIAYDIAKRLKVSALIACNYPIDGNKKNTTDYFKIIEKKEPKFLIEIHGHGAKLVDSNTIEISAGENDSLTSIEFAHSLKGKFKDFPYLQNLIINGNFEEVYFKAKNSPTVTDQRWKTLHIELPPYLRLGADNLLPANYPDFLTCICTAISEYCI